MDMGFLLKFIERIIVETSDEPLTAPLSYTDGIDTLPQWDSLVTVSIAAALSSELGVKFGVDDLECLNSVRGICSLIGVPSE